jgi:beta-lactamase regulating signal transducer with metallopeptidase domain
MNQFVILLIVKSTLVLVLAFAIASLLRSAAASARYAVWALAFATVVALPLAMIVAPSWRIGLESAPAAIGTPRSAPAALVEAISTTPADVSTLSARTESAITNAVTSTQASLLESLPMIVLLVWLFGSLLVGARVLLGRHSLRRIARRANPLTTDEWVLLVRRESQQLGIERDVRIMASDRVSTPLAAGIRSPVILLPADAASWTTEHRRIILRHELAHIARGDALVCLLSGIACAIYWVNPLVWIASRALRTEQERSCDDRVLTLGTVPTDYAEHLLEVARSARNIGMHSFVSVAMARPSQLEGRLLAVLQNRRRGSLATSQRISATAVAIIALFAIAALRPVRTAAAIVVAAQADSPLLLRTITPKPQPIEANTGTNSETESETATPEKQPVLLDAIGDSTADGDVAVSSGGTLVLDLKTGAGVRITGTDENRVRMHAILGGRDWRLTAISLVTEGSGARITSEYRNAEGNTSSSHRMEITVPRRFNIRLKSAGGSVFIRDLEGNFTGSTGGGEINIENARGSADLSTGGGPINVANSNLSGSVSTGGGAVLIQGVTGGLSGSSGTGAVFYGSDKVKYAEVSAQGIGRTTDGKVIVNKSGGSVSIASAPNGANISTGGGRVTIGDADGDVRVTTGGGDITIASASRSAHVTTGAGDVKVTVAGSGGYPITIESGNGKATLILPATISAELDLETAFTNNHRGATRIQSDWPVATTVTPDWDARMGTPRRYVRASQTIGSGGARITVRTVNGDIIIRRR